MSHSAVAIALNHATHKAKAGATSRIMAKVSKLLRRLFELRPRLWEYPPPVDGFDRYMDSEAFRKHWQAPTYLR